MFFDKLFCPQDELCLGLDGVKDRRCLREERADLLENADAGAGHVDADVLEVVAAHKFPDAFGLPEVGLVEPFVACDQPVCAAFLERRGYDDEAGVVTAPGRVIASPDRHVAERPLRVRVKVRPCFRVRITLFEIGQLEHGLGVVNELAHEEVPELVPGVFKAQGVNVEEVAAARDRVFQRDDFPIEGIGTDRAFP